MPLIGRRRPLARAAMVGGAAYYAGKKVEQGRQDDAARDQQIDELQQQQAVPAAAPAGGLSDDAIQQLKQLGELKDQGVLTEEEFQQQKQKLLGAS